jgi:photosystem II stability/assembly factor-like uncharacterized protein
MASLNYTPAKNAYSRVFLIKRRARGDRAPSFQSCLIAGSIEQSFGDIEKIECPHPEEYGSFLEVGTIRGAEERPTTSLTGRYASDIASELLQLAKIKCASDVQIHFGACQDPSDFNTFDKAIVLEEAFLTSVSTDELGSIDSGGQAAINESADLAGRVWYEVLPLTFSERASSLADVELVDVVYADKVGCGDCEDEGDGCEKIYAISLTAAGSPGTPADCYYSLDGGTTWYAEDVDGLTTNDADAIAVVGDYVSVYSNADETVSYILKSDLDGTGVEGTWTQVATGIVAASGPNDAWSVGTKAFVVGDGGYVYATEDVTAGLTVLDAGVASAQDLGAVHALSKEMALAVGAAGAIIYTLDGVTWQASPSSPAAVVFGACWMKSQKEWWVGGASGSLYYTTDAGVTWTQKAFSGSGAGTVEDIAFASDSVMYVAHTTAAPAGRILRSYNGGYSFVVMPEGSGSIPSNEKIGAIAACANDVNAVVGVGVETGTTGIIILGQD